MTKYEQIWKGYNFIYISLEISFNKCRKFQVKNVICSRTRSFLCGIAMATHQILAAIATKTYYNIESWLSLPGAILLYGWISVFG